MAYIIDDDENRIQELKTKIDELEIQTFSPEVVARNESTRNTGLQTGDGAATNPYPLWYPIRDFGSVGSLTLDIVLNRTDTHVAKLTAAGDIDFAFSLPPGTNKMTWFILDVTVDATGGYTFNLLNNILPAGITVDNSANARTVIRFTTTDAGVTYYAENLSTGGGGGASPLTTKGDIFGFNTADARIPISGTDGFVLTEDSTDPLGVAWKVVGAASQTPWGQDIDAANFNLQSLTAPTVGDQFRIIFDGHDDSDTFISNSTTVDRISFVSNGISQLEISPTGLLIDNLTDHNGKNITNVGILDFDGTIPSTGVIRIPNSGAIAWERVSPNGFFGSIEVGAGDDMLFTTVAGGVFQYFIGDGAPAQIAEFNVSGLDMQLNTISNTRKVTVSSNTTIAGFRDIGFTADPSSPNSGDLYYNTTSNLYRFYNGTVWAGFGGSTSFIGFTADADLNMGLFDVKSTINPTVNEFRIIFDGHDDNDTFISNSSTVDRISFVSNAVSQLEISPTGLLLGNLVDANANNIINVGFLDINGTVPTTGVIRIPNAGAITWERATPNGFFGEISVGSGDDMLFTTVLGGVFQFFNGDAVKTQIAEFNTTGLNMQFNDISDMGGGTINNLTADATPGGAADFVMTYDASANALKKVLLDNLPGGGGSGANTALSNLAAVAINTALLPDSVGALNVGSAAFPWNDMFAERYRLEVGGSITNSANSIIADSGGMIFNTPSGLRFEYTINGQPVGIAIEEDRIEFLTSGRNHRIDATTNSINIISQNITDGVELWPGASRSNEGLIVQDANSIFKNSTTGSAYQLLLQYSNAITTGQPGIGSLGFEAEDSANVQSAYAGIVTSIDDDTSTSRDGRMQLVVAQDNGTTERSVTALTGVGIDIQGGSSLRMSFLGATPVVKQSIPASPTTAQIASLLEAYGLATLT